jgi:hypothetical protein
MNKTSSKALLVVFIFYVSLFSLLFWLMPDRAYSAQENRYLKKLPSFTFQALFSGSFTRDFESYAADQFPFRDLWIGLKAGTEAALGKTENNGVFLCSEDTLISRFAEPDMELVDENIRAGRSLAGKTAARLCLALIPPAAAIWDYRLPENADTCDEKALIDYIYSKCSGIAAADIYSLLKEHKEEYVYYRTDHHWTTLGAYYGYTALAKALGLEPAALSSFEPETVTESFYGTAYSSSGAYWVKPDSIQIFVPAEGVTVTNYPKGRAVPGAVYDYGFLDKKDKYAMFFGGNTPRLVIRTGRGQAGKVLLLRDSYADCEVPFLFGSFSEIHLLDLRYYKSGVAEYIKENGIDTAIISYGLNNFATDTSIFLMGIS